MNKNFSLTNFIKTFFDENDCIIENIDGQTFSVQLSVMMDKALMNRPFYWQYVETMNLVSQPLSLSFHTDSQAQTKNSELVHLGSTMIDKIVQHLQKKHQFTLQYELIITNNTTMLHPWLVVNCVIEYKGVQLKEEMISLGINLINGVMIFNMMDVLQNHQFSQTISNKCYTVSPIIKLESGFNRIEEQFKAHIGKQRHQWAYDSFIRLNEEIAMIEQFYRDNSDDKSKTQEINDVNKRLYPKINLNYINAGIFYLNEKFINHLQQNSKE